MGIGDRGSRTREEREKRNSLKTLRFPTHDIFPRAEYRRESIVCADKKTNSLAAAFFLMSAAGGTRDAKLS